MTTGVVVGFDGSPASVQAVEWAALEAGQRRTTLRVVVAADYPGMPAAPTREWTPHLLLSSAQSHLEEGLRLASKRLPEDQLSGDVVVAGRAAGVLSDAARTADLLVTGGRSLDPARSAVLGSTSTLAASMAACPVAVAVGTTDPALSFTLPVTVGVTTSSHSAGALMYAAAAATRRGVPLHIVAAWAVPPTQAWEYVSTRGDAMAAFARTLRVEAEQAGEQACAHVCREHPELLVRCDVVEMQPWAALEDGSRRAGLLVVGSRGTGGFEGLRLGSVASATLEHSRCPVVVVPSP